jgi:hypothetical protein
VLHSSYNVNFECFHCSVFHLLSLFSSIFLLVHHQSSTIYYQSTIINHQSINPSINKSIILFLPNATRDPENVIAPIEAAKKIADFITVSSSSAPCKPMYSEAAVNVAAAPNNLLTFYCFYNCIFFFFFFFFFFFLPTNE